MADNISFGLKSFSVVNPLNREEKLLDNISGYVKKGGITAILGASGSGKSLMLQAVAARTQDLDLTGSVFMNGKQIDPKANDNPVAYVPQDDSLIGDLTAREVVLNTALLKRNEPREQLEKEVLALLGDLGLGHVVDTVVGTIIFRGLSGGQKKRAEVATELIASPSILILDEPTSGLDSSVAFEVLARVRSIVENSNGRISVVLSIHQPNSKMLAMFDHIMLLEKGRSIFFGTLAESHQHFGALGCVCPAGVTPTDYFLQVSDTNFSFADVKLDFPTAYRESEVFASVSALMEEHAEMSTNPSSRQDTDGSASRREDKRASENVPVPFWYQVYILVHREYTLAYRDPFLYYFQLILLVNFAILIGAVFWDLPFEVDGNFGRISGGLLWVVMPCCWVHAFKVYYLNGSSKRAEHEMLNAKYGPAAVLLADTLSTASLTSIFLVLPCIILPMIGFPIKSLPMVLLCCWLVLQAAEAMIALVTKLSLSATTGMIFAQICLVNLQVFGAGIFIPWPDCPPYWVWLQEITVFCQGSRIVLMTVYDHMTLACSLQDDGQCVEPGTGNIYTCVSYHADGLTCEVEAREILDVTQGVGQGETIWPYFAALVGIYLFLKTGVAFFTYYPINRVQYFLSSAYASHVTSSSSSAEEEEGGAGRRVSQLLDDGRGEEDDKKKKEEEEEVSQPPTANADTLSWTNFSVVLPKSGKKLVDNVSGFVKSGRICGLMGPSGAGKTTLLNGLADRAAYADLSGSVCFMDRVMTAKDLTYVPQFDEVNDVMTIRQHLELVGRLTCADEEEVQQRTGEILRVMGLTERQHTRVAHLSGGEIKRVSIGVGLISSPTVLFLDEPTTGLDSTAAYSIVQYLAKVAKSMNIAVIMTIHQPSALVFDMIDDLFLLEMGRVVYAGSVEDAAEYFSSIGLTNPEQINASDYYLDLIQREPSAEVLEQARSHLADSSSSSSPSSWSELFLTSPFGQAYVTDLQVAKAQPGSIRAPVLPPHLLRQFWIMCVHFTHYFLAEPGYFLYVCCSLLVIAVFNSTMFLQLDTETSQIPTYTGAMFTTAVAVMLSSVSSTALYARDRREAVDRIQNGYYHPGVYVWSQFLVSICYKFVATVLFVSVYHWAVDLNPTLECFLYDLAITWAHLILMDAVLMVFIEVIKNAFLCTTAGMIFIGTNMLFAGFFRPRAEMPPASAWACYLIPMYWSFQGFVWQIFITQDFDVTGSVPLMEMRGRDILDYFFDLQKVNSWGMLAVLLGYVLFFRLCQHGLLALQTGSRRRLPHLALPSFLEAMRGPSAVEDVKEPQRGGYESTPVEDREGEVKPQAQAKTQTTMKTEERDGQMEMVGVTSEQSGQGV